MAGYSSFRTRARNLSDLGDSEQTPSDLATVTDYAHLTALRAPRPTLLTYNAADNCCFASDHALPPLLAAARPVYRLYGKEDNLRWHVNHVPGTHNFDLDNRQALYYMFGDFFFTGTQFDPKEIPCEKELKSAEELTVALPEKNADFHTLALELCQNLPVNAELPSTADAAKAWQAAQRKALARLVAAKNYQVKAEKAGEQAAGKVKAVFWKLHMDDQWTVPAVELTRGPAQRTAILVSDDGRKSSGAQAERLLKAGYRVLAVDPFYFGESKIAGRSFLFALLVAAVGDRPLGLQESQVAAVARWSRAIVPDQPVTVVASGPRSSLFALVAGGLESEAIAGIELHGSLGSLREIIENDWAVNERPELFCFGLLKELDIKQMVALVAPRPVVLPGPSERVKKELAGVKDWYSLLGGEFQPIP